MRHFRELTCGSIFSPVDTLRRPSFPRFRPATLDAAIAVYKNIVGADLVALCKPGMIVNALYANYTGFA